MMNPKAKVLELPWVIHRRRGRNPSRGNTQKVKLLSSATPVAKTVKVHLVLLFPDLGVYTYPKLVTALFRLLINLHHSFTGRTKRKEGGGPPPNGHTVFWLLQARRRESYPYNDEGGAACYHWGTNSFRDCNRGLGALKPQEEMVKPESGNDREGSNNVLVDIIEETKNQGDN